MSSSRYFLSTASFKLITSKACPASSKFLSTDEVDFEDASASVVEAAPARGGVLPLTPCFCACDNGMRHMNSAIEPSPAVLTTLEPFQSSQTSFDVDDMSSPSASARGSRARPIIAFNQVGPPTRMEEMMMVTTPSGAIARMMLSAQPIAWLMNWVVTRSPNKVSNLFAARS